MVKAGGEGVQSTFHELGSEICAWSLVCFRAHEFHFLLFPTHVIFYPLENAAAAAAAGS